MTVDDILKLYIPYEFGSDEDGEETDSMGEVYSQLDTSVETLYGASKFVIILNDKEVVKIPFNGCYWYDEDVEGNWRFDLFINQDYCAIEEEVYDKAVDAGVEKFFASTKFYGNTKSKTPIYISERVYTFYDNAKVRERTDNISDNSWIRAKKIKEDFNSRLHQEWIARAIEYYGIGAVNALLNFIKKENIFDLHCENIGFRKDGSPVILDYSGYKEG